MKVLFDQGTPAPLRKAFGAPAAATAFELGWSTLQNGQLITAAEAAGFEVLVTTDRNLKYQQNPSARALAVVVLLTTSWPRIERRLSKVAQAADGATAGTYVEVRVE